MSSSSSSEVFTTWSKGKPLLMANSALINNRMAQSVQFVESEYNIGRVYCFLKSVKENESLDYDIHLGVYACDNDQKPISLISGNFINISEIKNNQWNEFDVNIQGTMPVNKILSFVMHQDGGDEYNYTMWLYSAPGRMDNKSFISKNGSDWENQEGVVRSLVVTRDFQPFDLEEFKIESPPANLITILTEIGGRDPIYENVEVNEQNQIQLKYSPCYISFIVDSSGSMTWNDFFGNRKDILEKIVENIANNYPEDYLFDFISFGGSLVDSLNTDIRIGSPVTINLDVNNPSRKSYIFITNQQYNFKQGDIYVHNGNIYEIYQDSISEGLEEGVPDEILNRVHCIGDGDPLDSGKLIKENDESSSSEEEYSQEIVFTSYNTVNFSNPIVAYGFKNMENGNTYNIGELKLDGNLIAMPSDVNAKLYHPSNETPSISIGQNAPHDSESMDVVSTDNAIFRKHFYTQEITRAKIEDKLFLGSDEVVVEDSSLFSIGNLVDFIDGYNFSSNHNILSIDGGNVEISPRSTANVNAYNTNNGFMEISGFDVHRILNGTTLQLLVKDEDVTRDITFFCHIRGGGIMEWDFRPFSTWEYINVYALNETAILPVKVFDSEGRAFPDGTKIVFEVDERKDIKDLLGIEKYVFLNEDAEISDDTIEISSTSGFASGLYIDILGGGIVQTVLIDGVDGNTIELSTPLLYDFPRGSRVSVNNKQSGELSQDAKVSISLPLMNVTSKEVGVLLDAPELEPYDPVQIDPSEDYDDVDYNRDRIKYGSIDMPTINGFSYCRVLPITEDVLTSDAAKDLFMESIIRSSGRIRLPNEPEKRDGDFASIETGEDDTTERDNLDYTIESPVLLSGGRATSSITTRAIDLKDQFFPSFNIPGVPSPISFKTKTYDIYPHVREENEDGTVKGILYLEPFNVNFIDPIHIHGKVESEVDFYVEDIDVIDGCPNFYGYSPKKAYGVHAGSDPIVIEYVVSNKGVLVQDGVLNINIYSSDSLNQEDWISRYGQSDQNDKFINMRNRTVVGDQNIVERELSKIDEWREAVNNNFISQSIAIKNENPNQLYMFDDPSIPESVSDALDSSGLTNYYMNIASQLDSDSIDLTYDFYSNPLRWVRANQYDENIISIPIVDGKARLEIPSNDKISTLFIEAIYNLPGSDYESIHTSLVFNRNPLMIGGITPYQTSPTGNEEDRFEIGGMVTWEDNKSGIIEDGTIVNYSLTTPTSPSVSKTISGWAGGSFMGPKNKIVVLLDENDTCPPLPVKEEITVEIIHSSGVSGIFKRNIYWIPEIPSSVSNFYFHVASGVDRHWSNTDMDTLNPFVDIFSDLDSAENNPYITQDIKDRLNGFEQPDGLPRYVVSSNVNVIPSRIRWDNSTVRFRSTGLNQNIGHRRNVDISDNSNYLPWDRSVTLHTSYMDSNGNNILGTGIEDLVVSGSGFIEIRPSVKFREPLGINIEIENEFARDGNTKGKVVVDVTWENDFIKNKVVVNKGFENEFVKEHPFPQVKLQAGVCTGVNSREEGGIQQYIDFRGQLGCCLSVEHHPQINLSSYVSPVSISRTSKMEINGDKHTHSCQVDKDGNGITTSTITIDGSVSNHVHVIENFEVSDEYYDDPSNIHNHDLRSVAIVDLLPTSNSNIDISIIGSVEYDPTNCVPYAGPRFSNIIFENEQGNRLMFNSYTDRVSESEISTKPELILELSTPDINSDSPTFYASESPTNHSRAFNIKARAYFSSYINEEEEEIPERDVDDGSRVFFDVKTFLPNVSDDGENLGIVVSGSDIKRNYMILQVHGRINVEGHTAEDTLQINIDSDLNWLPFVTPLNSFPTQDPIYISESIGNIRNIGGSAIYDAIRMSTSKMLRAIEDNEDIEDYKKAIILLTDGDENSSRISINQALNNISFIDGDVPVIPFKLGRAYPSNDVILNTLYIRTNGFLMESVDLDELSIDDLVKFMFKNEKWSIGYGTYKNNLVISDPSLIDSFSIEDVEIPSGTNVTFRYRIKRETIGWSEWSNWFPHEFVVNIEESIDNLSTHLEYEIRFFGSEDFTSPLVKEDLSVSYYRSGNLVLFFKSQNVEKNIDNGYVSSIHISHEGEIPETSYVRYGFIQDGEDTDLENYIWTDSDNHYIMLTRNNEPLITRNHMDFYALNGKWPDNASITVYRVGSDNQSVMVGEDEYTYDNKNGVISFYVSQNNENKFFFSIHMKPSFRIVCEITNYSEKQASIDHIGVVYNYSEKNSPGISPFN